MMQEMLFFTVISILTIQAGTMSDLNQNKDWNIISNEDQEKHNPIFEGTQMTNLTAHLGTTAILNCRLRHNHHNYPVSWIRLKDWNILSTGLGTFTKDERFSVRHVNNNDWSLAIKFVNKHDEGMYVCQVSTAAGSFTHYYSLQVLVPRAYILGSEEYYAQTGTIISLVCIVEDTLEPPQYVFWFHNNKIISYDTRRTRVSFDSGGKAKKTSSRLVISNVRKEDGGNYTCGSANAEKGTVTVFVSEGEESLHVRNGSQQTNFADFLLTIILSFSIAYCII